MTTRPVVVVLAAERRHRFRDRQYKLEQGPGDASVLDTTLRHAIESGLPVVVVTAGDLATVARRRVAARDVVILPSMGGGRPALSGLGHSIAAGVGVRADAPGWLILPGDMPMVRPSTLKAVADALAQAPVAYAQHRGRRGHPVGFSAELYSELVTLVGDEGARRLVARYPAQAVEVDDPGVLIDVDTDADLQRLRAAHFPGDEVRPPA